jgi:hypothetical protein
MLKTRSPKSVYRQASFPNESILMAKIGSIGVLGKSTKVDDYYREFVKRIAGRTLFSFEMEGIFKAAVDAAKLTAEEYYPFAVLDLDKVLCTIAPADFAGQAESFGIN